MRVIDFLHFGRPTEEQKRVLEALEDFVRLGNIDDFLILCGAAGTGKTSIISALVGYMNKREMPYSIAAPTGRAARILGRKANATASTIHSLIYVPELNDKTGELMFKLKSRYTNDRTIFIIDESSMLSTKVDKSGQYMAEAGLLMDLVKFVKSANPDSKLIFLGDKFQLPPIGEEQALALDADFLRQKFNFSGSVHELTEVKRQEDGSYILENAQHIRTAIEEDQQGRLVSIKAKRHATIQDAAQAYLREVERNGNADAVAISASNKANGLFNKLVRQYKYRKKQPNILEVGDLLLVVQNMSRGGLQLHNGDHIELLEVDWSGLEKVAELSFVPIRGRLVFGAEEAEFEELLMLDCILTHNGNLDSDLENNLRTQRYVKNTQFRESKKPSDDRYVGALRCIYGHAITCHKAQGGEWKKIFINTMGVPSLKWQYTAVTRGQDSLELF